jgi:hypothetical protein
VRLSKDHTHCSEIKAAPDIVDEQTDHTAPHARLHASVLAQQRASMVWLTFALSSVCRGILNRYTRR